MYYVGMIAADSNAIYHHGIKGQKWGVRRFQNEDGSLTEAGRQRYQRTEAGQKAEKELHDAYSRAELGYGTSHAKIAPDNGFGLSSEQEDKKGKFLLRNPDEWKTFEQIESEAMKNSNMLQTQMNLINASQRNRRSLGLLGKKELERAAEDFEDSQQQFLDEVMSKSVEYINKLPKRERDIYRDYVYRRLGLDW